MCSSPIHCIHHAELAAQTARRREKYKASRGLLALYFSREGSALTISSSTRQSAPGQFLGMQLRVGICGWVGHYLGG